jgi:hypothetical protein
MGGLRNRKLQHNRLGLVVSQFTNPWGASSPGVVVGSLNPARADLWQLDLSLAVTTLTRLLPNAWASTGNDGGTYLAVTAALPSPAEAAFLARTVQLPPRLTGVAPMVRRDNGPFLAPGYQDNVGRVQVTFAHEMVTASNPSAIWALLTVWRAFARAGQGPDFPGTTDLQLGLVAASPQGTLTPAYRYDVTLTLMNQVTGTSDETGTSLVPSASYVANNAWPVEFGVDTVSYEDGGRRIVEVKASFQCDDVTLVPTVNYVPGPVSSADDDLFSGG